MIFYNKSSKQFKKYEFYGQGKLIAGEKPNFFEYLKKIRQQKYQKC